MLEPRYIPPQMPTDPGVVRWQWTRRVTAERSIAGLAILAGVMVFLFAVAQGAVAVRDLMGVGR